MSILFLSYDKNKDDEILILFSWNSEVFMEMCFYFLSLFNRLNESEKKKFLRNIFLINDVSEYSVFVENGIIYFNIYFNFVYYRYAFQLKNIDTVKKSYVTFFHEEGVFYYFILSYLYSFNSSKKYSFDILSQFFLTTSKKEANVLFHQLL